MLKARRRDGGLSLFGGLLALVVFGVLAAGVSEWFADRAGEEVEKLAAAQMASLADAVGVWAIADYPARLAAAPQDVPLATLRAAGVLAPGFAPDGIDAMGRRFRILVRSPGPGELDVLVTHAVPAGDEELAVSALRAVGGKSRIGIVFPDEVPPMLRGPTVVADIAAFRSRFGGAPQAYALGILSSYDRQRVFGDFLYRGTVPGLPTANRMETTLDLGGNDVVAARDVGAESLVTQQDLDVGGDLTVAADLLVGGDAEFTGTVQAAGELRAQTARLTGGVFADEANVTSQMRAASVSATGQVRGGSLGTAGVLSAGSGQIAGPVFAGSASASSVEASGAARVSSLRAGSVNAPTLAVSGPATVSGSVTAGSVRATARLTARDAGFSTLVVGVCSGC